MNTTQNPETRTPSFFDRGQTKFNPMPLKSPVTRSSDGIAYGFVTAGQIISEWNGGNLPKNPEKWADSAEDVSVRIKRWEKVIIHYRPAYTAQQWFELAMRYPRLWYTIGSRIEYSRLSDEQLEKALMATIFVGVEGRIRPLGRVDVDAIIGKRKV